MDVLLLIAVRVAKLSVFLLYGRIPCSPSYCSYDTRELLICNMVMHEDGRAAAMLLGLVIGLVPLQDTNRVKQFSPKFTQSVSSLDKAFTDVHNALAPS